MTSATTNDDAVPGTGIGSIPLSRRALLFGGAAAAATATLALAGPAPFARAAAFTPIQKLPGEVSRKQNLTTPKGTAYDAVEVNIAGDRAWIMIPQSLKPYQRKTIGVVWYYHGSGSDHSALLNGFGYEARQTIDAGGVAICQNVAKNSYASPFAVQTQANGVAYLSALYKLGPSFLRATSGGGALAAYSYGAKKIPNAAGLYFVNAIYDVRASYAMGGQGEIGPAYGNDLAAIDATNPAKLPQSAWKGARIRIVYSTTGDLILPPSVHGIPFFDKAAPVGRDVSRRTHTGGHATPSFVGSEAPLYFSRWLKDWTATGA